MPHGRRKTILLKFAANGCFFISHIALRLCASNISEPVHETWPERYGERIVNDRGATSSMCRVAFKGESRRRKTEIVKMPTNLGQNSGQGSAKIYQFPSGGRAAAGGRHREAERSSPSGRLYAEANIGAALSGSWYHEEAIRESQRSFKDAQPKKSVVVPLPFPRH